MLDLVPNFLDAQVGLSFGQDMDDGAADSAELTPAIRLRSVAIRLPFALFTPRLTCETLE
jgi:hypothetical protein